MSLRITAIYWTGGGTLSRQSAEAPLLIKPTRMCVIWNLHACFHRLSRATLEKLTIQNFHHPVFNRILSCKSAYTNKRRLQD